MDMVKLLVSMWRQFVISPPTYDESQVPAQKGRVFIVTGGNAGVGFELCKMLRGKGATVYIASRSKERSEAAINELVTAGPGEKVTSTYKFLPLDLNNLSSVRQAAALFAAQESRLDVLWNQAGLGGYMVPLGAKTEDGIEALMGVNCVAPFLFTQLLLPQIRAAVPLSPPGTVRVVWTSSVMVDTNVPWDGIDFSKLETGSTDKRCNYARSKAGNWFLSHEFARRYGHEGIISVVQNPGNLRTKIFTGAPSKAVAVLDKCILHDVQYGGITELFAGFSPDVYNGAYVIPWGRIVPEEWLGRQDMLRQLKRKKEGGQGHGQKFWEWCEEKAGPVV